MRVLTSFADALRFLTVVPLPKRSHLARSPSRGATAWFPLVGLVIGLPLYGVMALPIPNLPRAALTLVLWVALTGGLHEDGFIDSLEAAVAPVDAVDRRRILADPHIGAHGVTAAVLLQLARFALLTAAPASAMLVAPVLGRWMMTGSLALARPSRTTGLGATLGSDAQPAAATLITVVLLAMLAPVTSPVRLAAAGGLSLAAAFVWGAFLTRRLNGLSGDGHGGVGVAAELAALVAFLPVTPPAL